jgi:hypothetical protein
MVAGVMFVCGAVGVGLMMTGLRQLSQRIRSKAGMVPVEGKIVGFRTRRARGRTEFSFPIIEYLRGDGTSERFESVMGNPKSHLRQQIGDSVAVLYDPDRRIEPMIASFTGKYLEPVALLLAGGAMTAVATVVAWLFLFES